MICLRSEVLGENGRRLPPESTDSMVPHNALPCRFIMVSLQLADGKGTDKEWMEYALRLRHTYLLCQPQHQSTDRQQTTGHPSRLDFASGFKDRRTGQSL